MCVYISQPNSPKIVMDYWTGWYDVWGDLHHVHPPEGKEALFFLGLKCLSYKH